MENVYNIESHLNRTLTITVSGDVHEGLYRTIGRRNMSRFIENVVCPYAVSAELEAAYSEMACGE